MTPKELQKSLKNIGPVCSKQLVKAGIDTPEKLAKIGAKKAFLKLFAAGGFDMHCFNASYLYALEGAILDCDWRMIPEEKKKEFKAFTQDLRNDLLK